MPSISVVIPAFNAEATIEETVYSVLQQSWSDFELIVIEPSSTDGTARVLDKFSDPRLRIIRRPQGNAGVNRNYGLSLARGEFTTFLDADDLWTPKKLEAQYQRLQQSPSADVCYSMSDCIDEQGNRLYPASHATWEGDVYEKLLLSNFVASGSNFLARTSVLKHIGGFDESLSNCEDLDICLRLAEGYDFVSVPRVQVLYRLVQGSKSSRLQGVECSNLRILERGYDSQKGKDCSHLRPESYINLYTFLGFKALRGWDASGWTALAYLSKAFRCSPKLLLRKDCYKIILRAGLAILLSPQWNDALTRKLRENRAQRYRDSLVQPPNQLQGRAYSSNAA